ncbi:MAG: hypothetical protein EOP83_29695 [Verrucomicrobiaceae bacterium]|nr:MAG: hypothetical protein EOP83_29695 [Verrucomicrobiaceae bacterium]
MIAALKLSTWRSRYLKSVPQEGCSEQELKLVYHCAMVRHHFQERAKIRKYEKHGLVKRAFA